MCLESRNEPTLTATLAEIHTVAPRHCLALALSKCGRFEPAEQAFREALTEDADAAPLLLDYANFLTGQNRAVEALQRLHEFVTRRPEERWVWVQGGKLALSAPEYLEVALDWTAAAAEAHPDDKMIAALRGEALLLSGRTREAVYKLKELGAEDPYVAAGLLIGETILGERGGAVGTSAGAEVFRWLKRLVQFGVEDSLRKLDSNVRLIRERCPDLGEQVAALFSAETTAA
jgi:tetratricopeptide (TPR) repeat protein